MATRRYSILAQVNHAALARVDLMVTKADPVTLDGIGCCNPYSNSISSIRHDQQGSQSQW
jgi:hypothetical protein